MGALTLIEDESNGTDTSGPKTSFIASDTRLAVLKSDWFRFKIRISLFKKGVSKISIIGVGMITTPGVTYRMFKALSQKKINIQVISTSEIKISVLIKKAYLKKAVAALHKEFKLEK